MGYAVGTGVVTALKVVQRHSPFLVKPEGKTGRVGYWWRAVRLVAIKGSAFIRCINVVLWPTCSSDDQEFGGKASSGQVKVQCLIICFSFLRPSSARGEQLVFQSPTWKCKEHCKSWNEPKDRAKVTPCLSETMQVNKSRSMRKWWRCQAAGSNCVHCI